MKFQIVDDTVTGLFPETQQLLDIFDEAAQNWGWQQYQGFPRSANAAADAYNKAKMALIAHINQLDVRLAEKDEPDKYCVTTPDGNCISNHPSCMHNKYS